VKYIREGDTEGLTLKYVVFNDYSNAYNSELSVANAFYLPPGVGAVLTKLFIAVYYVLRATGIEDLGRLELVSYYIREEVGN
jgi:hypothetical protein